MFLKPFDQLEMILVADAESVSEDIIRTVRKKLEKIMKLFQCRGMTFTKGRDAIGITGAKLPDPWDGDVYLSIRDPKTNTFAVAAKILAAVTKVLQQSPIEKPSFFHIFGVMKENRQSCNKTVQASCAIDREEQLPLVKMIRALTRRTGMAGITISRRGSYSSKDIVQIAVHAFGQKLTPETLAEKSNRMFENVLGEFQCDNDFKPMTTP